jgi:phage gpG-like protein
VRIEFSGDFAALNRFRRKVQKAPEVLGTVNEQLAEEAIELVRDGFEQSSDPYGKRWAPLKLRAGRPLEDSGGLKAGWHRRFANRSGFGIANAKEYAAIHQGGSGIHGPKKRRIVAKRAKALKLPGPIFRKSVAGTVPRKMVPEPGRLPSRWRERFVDTSQEVLTELFRG